MSLVILSLDPLLNFGIGAVSNEGHLLVDRGYLPVLEFLAGVSSQISYGLGGLNRHGGIVGRVVPAPLSQGSVEVQPGL